MRDVKKKYVMKHETQNWTKIIPNCRLQYPRINIWKLLLSNIDCPIENLYFEGFSVTEIEDDNTEVENPSLEKISYWLTLDLCKPFSFLSSDFCGIILSPPTISQMNIFISRLLKVISQNSKFCILYLELAFQKKINWHVSKKSYY